MLNDFINYLYKQQYKVDSEYKFYVSEVCDDRVIVDVYRYTGLNGTLGQSFEYYGKLIITDDIVDKFVTEHYDILFEEWFVKNYIKR